MKIECYFNKCITNCIFLLITFVSIFSNPVFSETINGNIEINKTYNLSVQSLLDDSNLHDPNGVHPGEKTAYFNTTITLKNTGTVPLENFILLVNKKSFEHFQLLKSYLELNDDELGNAKKMYSFLKNNMFHASSEHISARNPYIALSYWGYTLCYHNTSVIMNLFSQLGIKGRVVGRNSHTFAEFLINKKWMIFDGDQKMVYPLLNNTTLGGISDIIKDPFISIRVKKNGKYTTHNFVSSWLNTSRFALSNPNYESSSDIIMGKSVYDKSNQNPLTDISWFLYPGETLVFHFNQHPDKPFNLVDLAQWKNTNQYGLALMELITNPDRRPDGENIVRYPIVKIIDHENNKPVPLNKKSRLTFTNSKSKKLSVFMQRSIISMPAFQKGNNSISLLAAGTSGRANIKCEFSPSMNNDIIPDCKILNTKTIFSSAPLEFNIKSDKNSVEKIWWQISENKSFYFVLPNFDQIQHFAPTIKIDRLAQTFINPNTTYYFRAKIKSKDLWGEWSEPYGFSFLKPEQPKNVKTQLLPDKKINITWDAELNSNTDYLIFGSNRMDFVPDIYTPVEIIEQKLSGQIGKIKNKNLILKTKENHIVLDHDLVFYRIIPRKNGTYGNPSSLINTFDISKNHPNYLSKPMVLQLKASILKDKKYPGGVKDVQTATLTNIKSYEN